MDKILLFLIWPAGMAVIIGVAALLARRAGRKPAGRRLGRLPWLGYGRALDDVDETSTVRSAIRQGAVFLAVIVVGAAVIFGIMAVVGQLVLHGGPSIDKPIFHWAVAHPVHHWKKLMNSLTKIGDTWSTRMAAFSAAVCLAVTWRRYKWLPAFAFLVLSVLQRYLTHAIHLVAHRVGTPLFPHGTFPSGGSERCVVFFGLIAYFLWHEFSGRRVTAIWAGAAVAALAFNEGYSRVYLSMHWTTDVLSGWFYGILLLALFTLASRVIIGPPRAPEEFAVGGPEAAVPGEAALSPHPAPETAR